jgi:two-component system, LytTR family, response regulator
MTAADRLRVLIVDDERPARQKIRRFLSGDTGIEAVFEASDGLAAVQIIRDESPDLVFLDVQMPGLDGFGVAEALGPDATPHIVFVTAFDQYAVRAFEVHAVDYLLKPFDEARFGKALARAKAAQASRTARSERTRLRELLDEMRAQSPTAADRLLVEVGDRMVMLPVERIDRIEALRNYVRVYAGTEVFRLRATISRLEERLDSTKFVRINRSEIVNVERIAELRPWSHSDRIVVLTGGAKLRLSRRYRDRLDHFAP